MHLDHLHPGGSLAHAGHEAAPVHGCLVMDEGEGDELREASRLPLDAAQEIHVADPVRGRLHVAVHDGGGGADTEGVRGGDDLDPLVDGDAAARDAVAHLLVEDLR